MTVFNRIFGRSKRADNGSPQTEQTTFNNNVDVLEDLFLENSPPERNEDRKEPEPHAAAPSLVNSLKYFLDQNLYPKGYDDGYGGQTRDLMEQRVKTIKSEFRNLLSEKIAEIRQRNTQWQLSLVKMEGVSDRLRREIEVQVESNKDLIDEMKEQQALSAEDEGLVMKLINSYMEGFVHGSQKFYEEKIFLEKNNMFNQ